MALEYGEACPICGSNYTKEKYLTKTKRHAKKNYNEKFLYSECQKCWFVFMSNSINVPLKYYNDDYYNISLSIYEKIYSLLRKVLKPKIFRGGKGKRILDIGCGAGNFLLECKKNGFDVFGVDTSETACNIAKGKITAEKIKNCVLSEAHFEDNYFDVITMFHVLEHSSDVKNLLQEIKRILKPSGVLYVEVPNRESLEYILFKENWFSFDAPYHLNHFSKDNLKNILNESGFKILSTNTFSTDFPFSFYHSLLNYLQYNLNIKNELFLKTSSFILLPISLLISLLIRFFSLFGIGGEVIKIYATK